MSKNQDKPSSTHHNSDVEAIVSNGETINYLQNIGKSMLNDLKDFSSYSNQFFNSFNEKLAFECKSILQHSCKFTSDCLFNSSTIAEYKGKIDSMITDTNDRMRNLDILKQLREQLFNAKSSS